MPIVSYSINEGQTDPTGGRNVTIQYFDQDANVYTEPAYAPSGLDLVAKAQARMEELSTHLAEVEMRNLIGM